MSVKYSEKEPQKARFDQKAKVSIEITERDGNQFIVVKEHTEAETASTAEQAIEIPAALLPELKRVVAAIEDSDEADAEPSAGQAVNFAHKSEEEFARILDFYHIAWQYEPRAFEIEWDEEGNPTSSFTPDFYLPEHDQYIEITTLKQSLVTKKNRKVRRLRELYPEVNIKVLYASDFRKLIEKFAASGSWQEQENEREDEE
ncbi:MAG TPA: hypothetical protein VNN73_00675 [Blastocatellia bacterium]|nr:hypothetical protein [Blastocatellia bacterium]